MTTITLVVAGVGLYTLVHRTLVAQLDESIESEARLLASTVEQEGDELDLELAELDMRDFAPDGTAYLQLWQGERTEYRSGSLGSTELTPFSGSLEEPQARWVELPNGHRGRAVGVRFVPRIDDDEPPPTQEQVPVVLVVVRDASQTDQALKTFRETLMAVGSATLVLMILVLWLVAQRSLRPLEAVSQEIAQIGGDELSRRLALPRVPRELQSVVTRTNQLLERLDAAFKRERAFSQEVAHELRTPLAGLGTVLEVALRRSRSEEHYQAVVRDSLDIVGQLQRMVENLLRLARLESGREELQTEQVPLSDVLLDAWTAFALAAESRKLTVEWDLAPHADARADRGLLEVIVRNLVENAVAYADAGGRVRIATEQVDANAVMRVTNTGSLLSQEQAHQATQRFWRGERARTAGEHTGLGLALVERGLQALGGELRLRSSAGGEFQAEVTLPG